MNAMKLVRRPATRLLFAAFAAAAIGGCAAVGPDYVRPAMREPAAFKEAEGWKAAQPLDELPKGPWWEIYGIAELSELERQVEVSNQNVAQAEAQYRQARAAVVTARAAFFP